MSIIKKIYYFFAYGYKRSSKAFIQHLTKKGITIGEGTVFFSPDQIHVDTQYPFLIKIGKNVKITAGTRLLVHDYSWSVIKDNYREILGSSGNIIIEDNCFIGNDTIILKNSHIGKNCIIGAGSLVSGNIPDNTVAVGRPAKPVMSLSEFYEKRKKVQLDEAKNLFKAYYEKYHSVPNEEVFFEYFPLFLTAEEAKKIPAFEKQMNLGLPQEEGLIFNPVFHGYQEFVDECMKNC